ncbi:MAG: DUF2281 domain-containing protein [Bacteroidetes bacterium]|nr:DUF2281 domain-containing protein [Bacteroidota bacterium]
MLNGKKKMIIFVIMRAIKTVETKINSLTPAMIEELNHYLDYLINKRIVQKSKKLKQDWAGGLKDIKMSSVELQKSALNWR